LMGERIIVRPFRPGDGAAIWEAVEESREHILPWLPWGDKHKTLADSEEFARRSQARWMLREDMPVGIWERSTNRYLGGSGLHRINWDVPSFEIGYWLRKSAEGNGYMTEAVKLLTNLVFTGLSANRLEILAAVDNHRSAAIPRKLGFTHEATLRNWARLSNGQLTDMLLFSMTPSEYERSA
jgi:RimJ/RimL family protein N-acetyltransferase